MIVGLQITKNKDKFNKLLSLLNPNKFKDISFIHISDHKSLIRNFKNLDVLVCYGINPDLFSYRSDRLKWIHIGAAGVEDSLFDEIINSKVVITNAKGINSKSVAEFVLSQILYFSKRFSECLDFKNHRDWNQWKIAKKTTQLSESTLGIIGYGQIGKEITKLAKSFGMRVIATRRLQKIKESKTTVDLLLPMSDIDIILKESDYISLACPLTPITKNMINKKSFKLMKNSAVFINTSRGGIVNELDLINALKKKEIQGAALDVFSSEPLDKTSELFNLENVFLSPHISGNFSRYQEIMMRQFGDMLSRFIDNKSFKNRVCKKRLY